MEGQGTHLCCLGDLECLDHLEILGALNSRQGTQDTQDAQDHQGRRLEYLGRIEPECLNVRKKEFWDFESKLLE